MSKTFKYIDHKGFAKKDPVLIAARNFAGNNVMREARKIVRMPVYIVPDKQQLESHFSENLSTGGVFIRTEKILPENTSIVIKIRLPDNNIVITCKAEVAWINEPDHIKKHSLPPGMGIRFTNISLPNRQTIRNFLNRYC